MNTRNLIALTLCLVAESAYSLPIELTFIDTRASVTDGDVDELSEEQVFFDLSVPTSGTLDPTKGASTNTTMISMTGSGSFFSYTVDFAQTIDDSSGGIGRPDSAVTSEQLFFTATENTKYSLSGFYEVTLQNLDQKVSVVANLFLADLDPDVDSPVLVDTGKSQFFCGAPDRCGPFRFDLGDPLDMMFDNTTAGSRTGELIAGHAYRLTYSYFIFEDGLASSFQDRGGATATGRVSLQIGPMQIPEPATLGLMSAGLLALGFVRRRS